MLKIILLLAITLSLVRQESPGFRVSVERLDSNDPQEIMIKVTVTRIASTSDSVIMNQIMDYKRSKTEPLGNFVIELQRLQDGKYRLVEPTADINPTYNQAKAIVMKKGDQLNDTLYVRGRIYSPPSRPRNGLTAGNYRLRVYFNPNGWASHKTDVSPWLEFYIK